MACKQWRTHGEGGVVGGQKPHRRFKKIKNLSFWNHAPFFIQSLPKLLSCFSVLSNLIISLEKLIVMQ